MSEASLIVSPSPAPAPAMPTGALLNLLPVGVYSCDGEGRITAFNRRAAEIWGREPLIGDAQELFCGSFKVFLPDGTPITRDQTPMAMALRTGQSFRDVEAIVERPDGSRIWAAVNIDPLFDDAGRIIGAVNCFMDITERKRADQALRESRKALADMLQALPMAVYTTDAEGRIVLFNKAAEKLWGRAPAEGELWCGSFKLFNADGSPLAHEDCPMAIALRERRAVRGVEAVLERPDGTRVPFIPYPAPLLDEAGEMVGAVNMLVDITHHKQASERQELLINELNHRVKNTLALVQSIAGLTIRSSETLSDFREAFERRLGALSRAHDLLNRTWWGAVPLRAVLDAELAPFGRGRVELAGEDVALSPRQGIALTLILHELATNAAKHGALSVSKGKLRVGWGRTAGNAELILTWNESGGPAVDAPGRKGFGSVLIERSVTGDLGGGLEQHFDIEGYRCAIRFPLSD